MVFEKPRANHALPRRIAPPFCRETGRVGLDQTFALAMTSLASDRVWGKLSPLKLLRAFILSRYPLAILAGLLLAASFPKLSVAGFAWIAPGLMLLAALGKPARQAFRIGYVAGLAHYLASLYWLLLIPSVGFPILGWAALSAF